MDVLDWLRSKAAWHEANNAYGDIAAAIRSLADELDSFWHSQQAGAGETSSPPPDQPAPS